MNDKLTLPPHDLETERAVLGALLLGASFDSTSAVLQADDFYLVRHQRMFAAMHRLWSRNVPLDVLTVSDELEHAGELQEVGGRSAVAECVQDLVSGAGVAHHAQIVRELSVLRTLRTIGMQLQLDAEARKTSGELAREVEQTLFRSIWERHVSTWATNEAVMHDTLDYLEAMQQRVGPTGLPTGLRAVDAVPPGMQRSDLVIVAGRPGTGKTSFGLGVALASAKAGHRVAIASLEMSTRQLANRILSYETGVNLASLSQSGMSQAGLSMLQRAAVRLGALPIHYVDANPMTIDKLRGMVRQLKVRNGLDLLVVDYLQLMHNQKPKENRQAEITEISRGLKLLAKELDICVVALSQLNRKVEDRVDRRPVLADLRESGAIEQDADIVIMLYRDELYDEESVDKGVAEVMIRKNRNGPIGDVRVAYRCECAKFSDLAV